MASTANFRRIDIDQYDEDRVLASSLYHPDPRQPAQALADAQSKDRSVKGLLQRGDVAAALKDALRDGEWPYGEDSVPEIKQAKVRAGHRQTPCGGPARRGSLGADSSRSPLTSTGNCALDCAVHPQLDPLDRHSRPRPTARTLRTGAFVSLGCLSVSGD